MSTKDAGAANSARVIISPPNFGYAEFALEGLDPYVQLRFPQKAMEQMMDKMMKGSQAKKGQKREPRDFDADYEQAKHISEEGWCGMPASGFRAAMISACRIVGFQMTKGKLGLFIEADGVDRLDGMPLVKIEGIPEKVIHYVRNATGVVDLRARAMWRHWTMKLRVRYDADMFSVQDIANLLQRVGLQVGVGEGRPDSKKSAGMGWGTFKLRESA